MKILAIEKELPGLTAADFQPYLKKEALKVLELYQRGIISEIYFGKKEHNAIIIMECKNEEEALQILQDLPLVKNGLISFSVIELMPYNGFSRLKTDETVE